MDDSDIVISGVSGRFPNSINIQEFEYNLYNKIDMTDVDESRWKHFHEEVPLRTGKIGNLNKFDASFFSILDKHANWTDPQGRCLLEHAYEAILDAGISPQSLVGSKTGVFIGCSLSDSNHHVYSALEVKEGYGVIGNANFYLANRISYILGLCGPSFTVDTACSSSAYALDCAYKYIMSGACDAAIVGGSQLVLNFKSTIDYTKIRIVASADEHCRPFDENAIGFTRADTISCIFLQRKKNSKRVYAQVVYTNSNNDGFKKEGSSFPSRLMQTKLMEDFFRVSKISPELIDFVEAHSTGTKLGDPEEVAAIDAVFCKNTNRKNALPIGSLKSNMGHSEASSGIASIAKIILAFENQKIAPNINIKKLRNDIPAFAEGRIRVVTDVEDLAGPYISMNSFGLGGANAHILFKGNLKKKVNFGIPEDNLDRLVLWSGRTEDALNAIFDDITKRPLDAEYIGLLQNSQIQTNSANIYRGYGIFQHDQQTQKAVCNFRDIQHFNGEKRPIVFVYSGIGSQWAGMGSDLMRIPIFAETINRCHAILAPKGFDLMNILTTPDGSLFDQILNSYLGIISIEIALTNILNEFGVKPDYIIGHSVGEMGCAYADGCWTAEETILAAYERGIASIESKSIEGGMAAVGLNHKDVAKTLPPTLDIACHNGIDSTTISGPLQDIRDYLEKLKEENIFAREVQSSGLALHSRYIKNMSERLLVRLMDVIKTPRKRSNRWLSSSYPENEWNFEECKYSSAEYHTQNLLNPVLFEEVMKKIPENSLTIEIAPHPLLKSILKRSLKDGLHLSLTQRNCDDGVLLLMESLGKLFQNGIDMDIQKLYPPIQYPVSRGTPMISPKLKWNHSENYYVPYLDACHEYERKHISININDKQYEFIQGHVIDGKTLFPGTGWLCLVWEHFSRMHSIKRTSLPVIFEDVKFLRATSLAKNQDVYITLSIHRGSGRFELSEGRSAIAEGYIKVAENIKWTQIEVEEKQDAVTLEQSDFYKEMRLRGYYHDNLFKAVTKISDDGLKGTIKWNNEWTTFLDCLVQFHMLQEDTRNLILPIRIRKLIIDPLLHTKCVEECKASEVSFNVEVCPFLKVIKTGGIEIHGFEGSLVNRRRQQMDPVLECYKFVPYTRSEKVSKLDAAKICVQIAIENAQMKKVTCVEVGDKSPSLSEYIFRALSDLPLITSELSYLTSDNVEMENISVQNKQLSSFNNINIVIESNCTNNREFICTAKSVLHENGLIISKDDKRMKDSIHENLYLVQDLETDVGYLHIMKLKRDHQVQNLQIIEITANHQDWIEKLQKALLKNKVLVFSQDNDISGIIGLVNCIRKEPNGEKLTCIFIDDPTAPKFDIDNPFYKNQLELGLAINIFKNNQWGSYRHLELVQNVEVKQRTEQCFANCLVKGDLSTLNWLYGPLNVYDDIDIIKIAYSSLNFRDIMLATGKITADDVLTRIQQQCVFGFEYSGVMKDNRKVMGLGRTGAMATHYMATSSSKNQVLLWDVPSNWTLEEAATVPLVYATVYLAFFKISKIESGQSILIHAGSGGVGLAAIQVAISYGLDVFTTVGSQEKREYLLSRFPSLKPENIGNSRNTTFEQMICYRTKGKGVDYVLNSLSNDMLQASIRCVAKNGTFMEIGKFDVKNKTNIHLGHLSKRINFKGIFLDELEEDTVEQFKFIHHLIQKDIDSGVIKPLKANVFDASAIEEAFRFMASGKHIGKVLLKMRENPDDIQSLPIKMIPRVYCHPEEIYIMVGGLGGFGIELADWLVLRGCRRLLLVSSRGITNSYQAYRIKLWKSYGVDIHVTTVNVTTREGCEKLLTDATQQSRVGGIFNLAVALRDGIFQNQTIDMFNESLAPKATATKYLDEFSRKLCPSLKHFVIFSSVSCGRGNAGQSNYGMGNCIMERICEKRRQDGLPAKAIQWGAIGDVGLLADLHAKNMDMEISGTLPQGIHSCLEVLDTLLTNENTIVASMVVAEKKFEDSKKGNIIETIMNIMTIRDRKQISMESSLSKLGMDSLMGVEIQQVLERDYHISLTSQELRSLSMAQLERHVQSKDSHDSKIIEQDMTGIELLIDGFGDEKESHITILKLNNVQSGDTKVLIFPGFVGIKTDILTTLAESINYPAYILQFGNLHEAKTLDEIFESVKADVINFFSGNEKILLLGYSFGSLLAIKFVDILESMGKIANIVFIDGSPTFVHNFFNQLLPKDGTDDQFLEIVLRAAIKFLFAEQHREFFKAIFQPNLSIHEIFDIFLEKAEKQYAQYNKQYGRKIVTGLINRLKIGLNVNNSTYPVVKSDFKLIKASESATRFEDDYGWKKHTQGTVEVQCIKGNHLSILTAPELVTVIQGFLE